MRAPTQKQVTPEFRAAVAAYLTAKAMRVEIRTLDCTPEPDAYRTDGRMTRGALIIDPEAEPPIAFAIQEHGGRSGSPRAWDNRLIWVGLLRDCEASTLRPYLVSAEGQAVLGRIVDGYYTVGRGIGFNRRLVGKAGPDAYDAIRELETAVG